MRAHLKDEDRQCQGGGDQQVALERHSFSIFPRFGVVIAGNGTGIEVPGFIASLADCGQQRFGRRDAAHRGTLGGQIDRGLADAWHSLQCTLDSPHARCASHTLDGQLDCLRRNIVSGLFDCLHKSSTVD